MSEAAGEEARLQDQLGLDLSLPVSSHLASVRKPHWSLVENAQESKAEMDSPCSAHTPPCNLQSSGTKVPLCLPLPLAPAHTLHASQHRARAI
jgi:hypothetical protein